MKTAIVYIRLSPKNRDTFGGSYYGDDAQLAQCQAWAASNGVEIVGVHRDINVSGAASIAARPGLYSAMEDVKAKRASFLLVGKRDRLARETLNALIIERDLAKVGARVVQANGMNEDTAEMKMIRTILDAVAEYEREVGRARTKAALAALKARGGRIGRPPAGWRVVERDGARQLEPIPGYVEPSPAPLKRLPGASTSSYDWETVNRARRADRASA